MCIYLCTHTHIPQTPAHARTHRSTDTHTLEDTHTHSPNQMNSSLMHLNVYTHILSIHKHMHMRMHVHMCTHMRIHMRIHTFQVQRHSSLWRMAQCYYQRWRLSDEWGTISRESIHSGACNSIRLWWMKQHSIWWMREHLLCLMNEAICSPHEWGMRWADGGVRRWFEWEDGGVSRWADCGVRRWSEWGLIHEVSRWMWADGLLTSFIRDEIAFILTNERAFTVMNERAFTLMNERAFTLMHEVAFICGDWNSIASEECESIYSDESKSIHSDEWESIQCDE